MRQGGVKRVTFFDMVQCHATVQINDMTPSEICQTWYSQEEIAHIRETYLQLVKTIKALPETDCNTLIRIHGLTADRVLNTRQRLATNQRCRLAVLCLQERLWNQQDDMLDECHATSSKKLSYVDPLPLAEISMKMSVGAVRKAQRRSMELSQEIAIDLKEDMLRLHMENRDHHSTTLQRWFSSVSPCDTTAIRRKAINRKDIVSLETNLTLTSLVGCPSARTKTIDSEENRATLRSALRQHTGARSDERVMVAFTR